MTRAARPLSRVRGSSNVVYIGQSGGGGRGGRQGIGRGNGSVGRLFNTRGRGDLWVRESIEAMFAGDVFQVCCHFMSRRDNPKSVERRLLRAYLQTHLELPPANHQSVEVREGG